VRPGFQSLASIILVGNVVGELKLKKTAAALCSFLVAARLSCFRIYSLLSSDFAFLCKISHKLGNALTSYSLKLFFHKAFVFCIKFKNFQLCVKNFHYTLVLGCYSIQNFPKIE